jgi:RimJ/RimL family protein N-acetyltransferase
VAKAVTDYWFSTTQGERMLAYVVPENVGSVRAVTKIGYTRTRTIDYLDFAGNPPGLKFDTPLVDEYELTRAQWEATQPL